MFESKVGFVIFVPLKPNCYERRPFGDPVFEFEALESAFSATIFKPKTKLCPSVITTCSLSLDKVYMIISLFCRNITSFINFTSFRDNFVFIVA